jgi:hypothetical protein
MADNKQTDKAMVRRLWIRRKQDDAYFGHHSWRFWFWDTWVGGWFGMDSYYDSRHQ